MRVSSLTFPERLSRNLGRLAVEQMRLQDQAASGQRLSEPDQDPAAVRRFLDLQAEFQSTGQFLNTIDRLEAKLQSGYRVATDLRRVLERANELAKSTDGLSSSDTLKAYATEVNQLLEQAVALGNTREEGVFLFGGTRNDQAPFVVSRDANGRISGYQYAGSPDAPAQDIAPGVSLAVVPPGANDGALGANGLFRDARGQADVIQNLISLRDALESENRLQVNEIHSPALDRDLDNVLTALVSTGATQARLSATARQLDGRASQLTGAMSREVDADLAQTLVSLNEVQAAYSAALQSGGKILRQSLLDYV